MFGAIKEIRALKLIISVSNGYSVVAPITEISDELNAKMAEKDEMSDDNDENSQDDDDHEVDLNLFFKVGQLVRFIVLEERITEKTKKTKDSKGKVVKKKQIIVSLKPSLINKNRLQNISSNMNIYGSIAAEEDYGYVVHFGENQKKGFLKKTLAESDKPFQMGQPIECLVCDSYSKKSVAIPLTRKGFKTNETTQTQLTIQALCAGMLVSVKILNVVESGLIVRLLDFFNATIPLSQIGYSTKSITEKYKKGKIIKARIFYIDYDSKSIYMGCTPHLLQWEAFQFPVEIGNIFNNAKIIKAVNKYGIFMKLPSQPTPQVAYASVRFFSFFLLLFFFLNCFPFVQQNLGKLYLV